MGAGARTALAAGALWALLAGTARADEPAAKVSARAVPYKVAAFGEMYAPSCIQRDARGEPYPVCFDLENRLAFEAASDGFGVALQMRHVLTTDDPGITWRFQHRGLAARVAYPGLGADYSGTVYEGRYTRHSRDGYLTLPTSPPRRLFLPFDVGAEATVLRVQGRVDSRLATVRAVRAGAFLDLARADDFCRRLTIGTAVIWDMDVRGGEIDVLEHRVAPFSTAALDGYLEAKNGLTRAGARVEAGGIWSNVDGWRRYVEATGSIERVLLAVNDRPLALYVEGGYADPGRGFTISAGVRFAVFGTRPWAPMFKVPEAAGP